MKNAAEAYDAAIFALETHPFIMETNALILERAAKGLFWCSADTSGQIIHRNAFKIYYTSLGYDVSLGSRDIKISWERNFAVCDMIAG